MVSGVGCDTAGLAALNHRLSWMIISRSGQSRRRGGGATRRRVAPVLPEPPLGTSEASGATVSNISVFGSGDHSVKASLYSYCIRKLAETTFTIP